MSEANLLSQVADLLRPVSKDISNGRGKLCLSTVYLKKLNCAFDENVPEDLTSSFHLTDAKAILQRDLQFLLDLVKDTIVLKITPDLVGNEESNIVSLRRFKNIKMLEISKIDVRNVLGIQRLRSQIQELSCTYNLETLSDILSKCGGDLSNPNLWSELKIANFSHNHILDIDSSFESTPWLNTLDLSYNTLTEVEFVNHLPNLKNLNLSYNKLEKVPRFRGPICKRLQILLLNNNFIEDLSGLSTLTNLSQIDLSLNCLTDHKCFLSISHMPSLCFLNLQGNPIHFHPHHRTITCNYLNKNTVSLKFVLDNVPLNKTEKSLAGSLYPVSGEYSDSSYNSLEVSTMERTKKVRNVKIQDGFDDVVVVVPMPDSTPKTSSEYLDLKIKIEQLHKEHGDSWLHRQSGSIIEEVLGFKKNENEILTTSTPVKGSNNFDGTPFVTAQSLLEPDDDVEEPTEDLPSIINYDIPEPPIVEKENYSDDEEVCDGEIFFASSKPDSDDYDLSLIVTETRLSERDSSTAERKERWDISSVKFCQQGNKPNEVQIAFDTLRTDKKSRTYYMDEAQEFVKLVFDLMVKNKIPAKRIQYQCLKAKCNEFFSRTKVSDVLVEQTVLCPKCGNNMVIEIK